MRLLEARGKLLALGQPVIDVRDAAATLAVDRAHASKIMTRLAADGALLPLARGSWAIDSRVDPRVAAQRLAAPDLSYVSLQTALFHHGMISQIPAVTYLVTTGRARKIKTPLGTISFHRLDPGFFFGYEAVGPESIQIATPEKALLDLLYLSPARSRIFHALPELEIPRSFSAARAREMIAGIPRPQRRTLVRERFERLMPRRPKTGTRVKA